MKNKTSNSNHSQSHIPKMVVYKGHKIFQIYSGSKLKNSGGKKGDLIYTIQERSFTLDSTHKIL